MARIDRCGPLFCPLPADAPTKNHLDNTLITASRECRAVTEIELPLRTEIEVDDAEQLMLLLGDRVETVDGAGRAVVLDREVDLLRGIEAEIDGRCEPERRRRAWTAE